MTMADFLQWAHDSWLGQTTRDVFWLYTTGLVIHFTGLCLLMGAMLLIDLRLLGFFKQIPVDAALKFLPWALVGFGMNAATGIMFFAFDPFGFWGNPAFKIKLTLLLLAGANALWFTLVEHRKLSTPNTAHAPSALGKVSAGLSLSLWFAVILFGRLIVAFQGSHDLFK